MAVQGQSFSDEETRRIVLLLSETEMTISEIAARMGCSCRVWLQSIESGRFVHTMALDPPGRNSSASLLPVKVKRTNQPLPLESVGVRHIDIE